MIHFGNLIRVICVVGALSVFASRIVAQDSASPSDKKEAGEEEKKADAKKADAKKDAMEINGVFEATESSRVILEPKEWTSLTVVEATEHGADVGKGDVLIRFDTDKIDDAIRDAESALEAEGLTIQIAEIKYQMAKRTQQMALDAAQSADRVAMEDMKEFINNGRERRVESVERSVQSARDSLEYQEEELRQLEKMYKADDLTEDTEEIILKRTRNGVERSKYFLDSALQAQRNSLKYSIPRSEEELQRSVKKASMALEEAERSAEGTLKQQELALEKQKRAHEKNEEKLERLRADRKLLVVRAPAGGVVYYGAAKRGKWSDPSSTAAMLVPGGTVKPKSVIMTIVKTSPLRVRMNVPEASKRHVKSGTKLHVVPIAYPDVKLNGIVRKVSAIPVADGVFDGEIEVELDDLKGDVVPGMKAKVKIADEAE